MNGRTWGFSEGEPPRPEELLLKDIACRSTAATSGHGYDDAPLLEGAPPKEPGEGLRVDHGRARWHFVRLSASLSLPQACHQDQGLTLRSIAKRCVSKGANKHLVAAHPSRRPLRGLLRVRDS